MQRSTCSRANGVSMSASNEELFFGYQSEINNNLTHRK